jgi:hypothetical protein
MENYYKFYIYRYAYSQMKKAMKEKFIIEAITIQERIITDRLLNFVIRNKIKNISED